MNKKEAESRGKTEADFLDDLRSLSVTAAHELLSGFDRLKQLRDDWETSDEAGAASEARKQREQTKSLAFELARHEIKHAEKILSLSHRHADMLFEHARRLVRRTRSGGDAPAPSVVDLVLSETERNVAVGTFEIRSPFGTDADPRFHFEPFATQSGARVAGLHVSVECDPPCVPPHGVADITVRAKIASDCEAGVYFTELRVFLVGDVEQRVARRLLRLRIASPAKKNASRAKK
jgi:hypothetical protein